MQVVPTTESNDHVVCRTDTDSAVIFPIATPLQLKHILDVQKVTNRKKSIVCNYQRCQKDFLTITI